MGQLGRSTSVVRRLLTVTDADVVVSTGTPLPLRLPENVVTLVHDVRWAWTRSHASRFYRRLDLERSLARSKVILTVSQAVAAQLVYIGKARHRVVVIPVGPGQFEGFPVQPPQDSHRILLLGNAYHKRNEVAASLLAQSSLARARYSVIGVNLSDSASRTLSSAFPSDALELYSDVGRDDLGDLFRSASVFLALGTSEGFGLSYVEATYFGCDVITPKQPVAVEVLGRSGTYLSVDTPAVAELEQALSGWTAERVARLQERALGRTWHDASSSVADIVAGLLGR